MEISTVGNKMSVCTNANMTAKERKSYFYLLVDVAARAA